MEESNQQLPSLGAMKNFGKYEIIEEIARGGMGVVFKANEKGINRTVALKVMLTGTVQIKENTRRFQREAQAAALLQHPNIVPIYKMGSENGYPYFSMKYIEGKTFDSIIDDQEMKLQEKVKIFLKICHALDFAHKENIIHRDIKPSNILIDANNEPHLTDFGLAKKMDSKSAALTKTGSSMGTPFYMSPEQIVGNKKQIGPATDLFSMGVVLYQVLTGERPFVADQVTQLYIKIMEEDPPPPSQYSRRIPKALEAICLKAIEKDLAFRYSSMSAMITDLENYLAGKEVAALRTSSSLSLRRFVRKNRSLTLVLALVTILCGVIFLAWQLHQKQLEALQLKQEKLKSRIQQVIIKAVEYKEAGQYQQAVQLLHNESKKQKNLNLMLQLAEVYQLTKDWDNATKVMRQVIRDFPNDDQVIFAKAQYYHRRQDKEKSLQGFLDYLKKVPSSFLAHRYCAQIYYQENKIDLCRTSLVKANSLEEKQLRPDLNKILTVYASNPSKSLALFRDLFRLYPMYEQGYYEKAKLTYSQQEPFEALADISRAIELNPLSGDYLKTKSQWLFELGQLEQAIETLDRAIPLLESKDELNTTKILLARCKFGQRRYREVLKILSPLATEQSPRLLFLLGKTYVATREEKKAKVYLEKLVSQQPSFTSTEQAEILFLLGKVELTLANISQAENYLKQSANYTSSTQALSYYTLGKIAFSKNKISAAITHLEKSIAVTPNAQAYSLLGKCYLKKQDWPKAIHHCSQSVALEPWLTDPFYTRAEAYQQLSEYDKAEIDFLSASSLTPRNPMPYLKIVDQLFEYGFRKTQDMDKCLILLRKMSTVAANLLPPDLFQDDFQAVCEKYIQSINEKEPVWNEEKENKSKILIQSVIRSNSAAVLEMASIALDGMKNHNKINDLITSHQARKELYPGQKQRLLQLKKMLEQKHLRLISKKIRQLLVRYYYAHEDLALNKIYYYPHGTDALRFLVEDAKESEFIRLYAAKGLVDLKSIAAEKTMREILRGSSQEGKVYLALAFHERGLEWKEYRVFEQVEQNPSVYFRCLVAKYLSKKQKALATKLLEDKDHRVRMYAAIFLRADGNLEAEKKLINHFKNPNLYMRANALYHYWQLPTVTKHKLQTINGKSYKVPYTAYRKSAFQRSRKYLQILLSAIEDENALVRRIAIKNLDIYLKQDFSSTFSKCLTDPIQYVRYQALLGLVKRGKMDLALPFLLKADQLPDLRVAAFFSFFFSSMGIKDRLVLFNQARKDPDPRVRLAVYSILGRMFMENLGWQQMSLKMITDGLKSSDYATRLGCAMAAIHIGSSKVYKMLNLLLTDRDSRVRMLGAAAKTRLLYLVTPTEQMKFYRKLTKSKDSYIRQGGSMGYLMSIRNQLGFVYNESIPVDTIRWEKLYKLFIEKMVSYVRRQLRYKNHSQRIKSLIETFDRSISLYPSNSQTRIEKGILFYGIARYRECSLLLEKALQEEQSREVQIVRLWLASSRLAEGKYDQAIAEVEQGLKLFPWEKEFWQIKATALQALGKKEQAKLANRQAQIIVGESPNIFIGEEE